MFWSRKSIILINFLVLFSLPTFCQPMDQNVNNSDDLLVTEHISTMIEINKYPNYSLLFDTRGLTLNEKKTVTGFWIVISTFILFLLLLPLFQKGKKTIAVYRPYEERLLKLNKLDLEDLLEYHSQFKWGDYSGIAIGMVLLSITLILINIQDLTVLEITIQSTIIVLMVIAVILLVFGDLVHTNSQTPIIPIGTRFKLISLSVQFGTLGTILLVFAVLLFTCMVSLSIVMISCFMFLAIFWYSNQLRRIPKSDFFRYFGIINEEEWMKGGEGIKENDKKNNLFKDDPDYIRSWDKKSKEVFYQKMKSSRPLSIQVEEWIQEMFASGNMDENKATTLRSFLPKNSDMKINDPVTKKDYLKESFVKNLLQHIEDGKVSHDELSSLLTNFACPLNWDKKELEEVSRKLGVIK